MTRRRFRIDRRTGELVEVSLEAATPPERVHVLTDAMYDGLRATDGTDISSRTKHRDYCRARGLVVADSSMEQEWARAKPRLEAERLESTKADVIEAYRELREKRGRR